MIDVISKGILLNMLKKRGKHSLSKNKKKVYNKKSSNLRKRKLNKKKIAIVLCFFLLIILLIAKRVKKNKTMETAIVKELETDVIDYENDNIQTQNLNLQREQKEIDDWRLVLANYENLLPEDFYVEVSNIDKTRQFDSRAIGDLNNMMNDMKKSGITNIWIQSAYRSVERQKELYDNSVQKYLKQGKTKEEAERLTDEYINKPGSSDHNLGLAVDFNYVDNKFEKLEGFKWLKRNAENYGFVLRYPKDKEDVTQIAYESWHWRYVGNELS